MKLGLMAVITALITLIAEIAFICIGNGAGAGITLAFGLIVSYTFRFLYELKGGE